MDGSDDYQGRILRVLLAIERELDRTWTLEELARIASFSPHHFHRVFSAMVGESVAAYLRRVRLEWAAAQLTATNRPIIQIAEEAGYAHAAVFTRAFARRFGASPSSFRRAAAQWRGSAQGAPTEGEAARVAARWRRAASGAAADPPKVDIIEVSPQRCAFVRATGRYALAAPRAWLRMSVWAHRRGIRASERRRFSVGRDDPAVTDHARLRFDACVALMDDEAPRESGGVGVVRIYGGEYARLEHAGPMSAISGAFAALYGRWLPSSGREPAAAPPLIEHLDSRFPSGPPGRVSVLLPLAPP